MITCSAGTYIRCLGRDLGEKLNTCATMVSLIRTKTGPFLIENTLDYGTLTKEKLQNNLISLQEVLIDFEKFNIQYLKEHNMFKIIYEIIETFGPIHLDIILRKMAKFLNVQKVTSKLVKEFENELLYNPDIVLFEENDYFCVDNNFKVSFRYEGDKSDKRDIKYINDYELKDAMIKIIKYKGGILKDTLYRVITKLVNSSLNCLATSLIISSNLTSLSSAL